MRGGVDRIGGRLIGQTSRMVGCEIVEGGLLHQPDFLHVHEWLVYIWRAIGAVPGRMIAVIWSVDMDWVWMQDTSVVHHLAYDDTELTLWKLFDSE